MEATTNPTTNPIRCIGPTGRAVEVTVEAAADLIYDITSMTREAADDLAHEIAHAATSGMGGVTLTENGEVIVTIEAATL